MGEFTIGANLTKINMVTSFGTAILPIRMPHTSHSILIAPTMNERRFIFTNVIRILEAMPLLLYIINTWTTFHIVLILIIHKEKISMSVTILIHYNKRNLINYQKELWL